MMSLALDHAQPCLARFCLEGTLGVLREAKRKLYLETKSVLLYVLLVIYAVSANLTVCRYLTKFGIAVPHHIDKLRNRQIRDGWCSGQLAVLNGAQEILVVFVTFFVLFGQNSVQIFLQNVLIGCEFPANWRRERRTYLMNTQVCALRPTFIARSVQYSVQQTQTQGC